MMNSKTVSVAAGVLMTAALYNSAALAEASPDVWHFTVGPEFGAQGFKGNGAVGPMSGGLKMPFHKVAKDTRFALAGGIVATRGPLGLWLNGQYLDLSQHFDFDSGNVHGDAKGHATQLSAGA